MGLTIDRFANEYSFLSNFYPAVITYEGITYPTVEHAYQAAKTDDVEIKQKIANLETPAQAKHYGAKIKPTQWFSKNLEVMENLVRLKFQIPELKEKLLSTGDATLIEGNWWNDKFWGICRGEGENNLGKLLMKIREELKNEVVL